MRKKGTILRRALAIILCAALILGTLAACGSNSYDAEREALHNELYEGLGIPTADAADITLYDTTTANFTLAYSKTDSLNPYKCTSTLNSAVSHLLFDSLYVFDSQYEMEFVIAKDITWDISSLTVSVTLRSGIVFSDGTPLTADDVRYSFYAAKKATSKYAKQLENFKDCTSDGMTVTFNLATYDPMAYMLLDIPIIKRSSDAKGAMPVGSGRYVYVSHKEKGIYLQRNELWFGNDKPKLERISLTAMPTIESIVHSIEIGTISYFYTDLRDGYPTRVSADFSMVDINNLVYLGVNTNDSRLFNQKVRRAITLALDREELATKAFNGRAYAATGPLTTSWPDAAGMQSGSTLCDANGAVTALNEAGFVNQNENGKLYNADSSFLNLSILVCSDNAQHMACADAVKMQLEDFGFTITIYSVPFEDFQTRLASGNYQMYIAEYAMKNNMDFSELFTPGKGLYIGPNPELTVNAWADYRSGALQMSDVITAFDEELPFIPLCFRLGMVIYTRSLVANVDVSESDPFFNMQYWESAAVNLDDGSDEETSSQQS